MKNQYLDDGQGNIRYFDSQNLKKTKKCSLAYNPKPFTRSDIPTGISMGGEDCFTEVKEEQFNNWMLTEDGHIMTTECDDNGNYYILTTE